MQDETLPTFEAVQKLLFDFESTLERRSITIESGSQLEQIGLAILDLLVKKKEPALVSPSEDSRSYFASILGLRVFMTKVVAMKDHPDFCQLLPHLRKMNSGQVPQNVPSGILDRVSPRHFELLIVLATMQIGTNLELDDPDESSGGLNPDVMITVDGIRYGLTCKALFGLSSQALIQNLEKGID